MKNTHYSDLLDNLKKQAIGLTNSGQDSYLKLLERLAKENLFKDLHQLQQLVRSEALAVAAAARVLECTSGMDSIYRVRIGGSIWSLQVSKSGPVLCLEDRPDADFEDDSRTSDLGLFQVLVKAAEMPASTSENYPTFGWVVTRYGQYRMHTAEFFSDEDAKVLSYQFGIPFASGSFSPRVQQERSEIFFLKSPAFASLRMAMRCGKIHLPPMKSWNYGLCSIWPHLVAMSDEDFNGVERILDWCFQMPRNVKLPHDSLFDQWDRIPHLGLSGKGTPGSLGEMFRVQDAARKARARNVRQVRSSARASNTTD